MGLSQCRPLLQTQNLSFTCLQAAHDKPLQRLLKAWARTRPRTHNKLVAVLAPGEAPSQGPSASNEVGTPSARNRNYPMEKNVRS